MAKKRFPRISPEEAHAALRWLHALGKVRSADIVGALRRREQLVKEIQRRLEQLGGEGLRFMRGSARFEKQTRKARKRVSAAARAAWKAQGRYLGAVRQLSKANRQKVKVIRAKSGVRAAIREAKRLGQQTAQ